MTLSLDNYYHVHFIGVGGIGMSALARLLLARGYQVSGSDAAPGEQATALAQLGAQIQRGHHPDHIAGADLVVVTPRAIPGNPEVEAAQQRRVPLVHRAEMLAAIMNKAHGIAIAGTHGKTTTTALLAHILVEGGLDPTVLVGGVSANLGSNVRIGGSDLVVAEADEFDAAFLALTPHLAVITNVEPDHLDYYGTFARVQDAFRQFARSVRVTLVVCADDPLLAQLAIPDAAGGPQRIITYGLRHGGWQAGNLRSDGPYTRFTVSHDGSAHQYAISLAGEHHVANATAAIAVATELGVPAEIVSAAVAGYRGVARRFERIGEAGNVLVMDDYAVHPTEIRVTLQAAQQRFGRPLRVIFQPHTYSRTKTLLPDFAAAFTAADYVYLMDIYSAGETDTCGISGRDLAAAVERHVPVMYVPSAEEALAAVAQDARPGDLVMTMGAGNVNQLAPRLLAELNR